jgi:hypothetical protein
MGVEEADEQTAVSNVESESVLLLLQTRCFLLEEYLALYRGMPRLNRIVRLKEAELEAFEEEVDPPFVPVVANILNPPPKNDYSSPPSSPRKPRSSSSKSTATSPSSSKNTRSSTSKSTD